MTSWIRCVSRQLVLACGWSLLNLCIIHYVLCHAAKLADEQVGIAKKVCKIWRRYRYQSLKVNVVVIHSQTMYSIVCFVWLHAWHSYCSYYGLTIIQPHPPTHAHTHTHTCTHTHTHTHAHTHTHVHTHTYMHTLTLIEYFAELGSHGEGSQRHQRGAEEECFLSVHHPHRQSLLASPLLHRHGDRRGH